jgi:calcium/calmodulin-dependent protein kinase I
MSRWLKKGIGQNNYQQENDFAPPTTTTTTAMAPSTAATASAHTSRPPQPHMVSYGTQSQGGMAMDVDQQDDRLNSSNRYYASGGSNGTSSRRHSSRASRVDEIPEGARSRSNRSTASRQTVSNGSAAAPLQYHYRPQSATPAASPPPPQQFSPPFKTPGTPPPTTETLTPSFPPAAVTADSPPQSQPAQRRPAYLLHRDLVIGKGSYGQVCIASRGEPEGHSSGRSGKRKKFACKCVMLRNDPKYIAKLQEEVNVLRELRGHNNVIRLYDVFCVDNELFIITELGRGGDLFHLLTTHPKHGVTESYAAKTVAEMLSAVAFLHSRSICHRDLKLENWVLESGKDVWSPLKLIDFGLSTHFSPGQRLSRVVGSSYYVAPEVLKKSYTEACDLWSLGVIVYMLLSGAPPFYGRTMRPSRPPSYRASTPFHKNSFATCRTKPWRLCPLCYPTILSIGTRQIKL